MVKKKGKEREKTTTTLSEKKEEASNVNVQWDLAVTTTWQGNRRSRTTPHKERMRSLIKHRY